MTRWLVVLAFVIPSALGAQTPYNVTPQTVTEWKAIYGRIETQDRIPARARIGGTLRELSVREGDLVTAGQVLGEVVDEKLDFQISALDSRLQATASQLENAESELARGEELLARGVTTAQRLDALRTQADVLRNQIAALQSERRLIEQQAAEGRVLAPISGRVLTVPVTTGAVIMPGEVLATIGGGGFFLRLAVPERHAGMLAEGDTIRIDAAGGTVQGRLAKLYPQIENGRVIADVEVPALDEGFVDARVLVRLQVGTRQALLVPEAALSQRFGLDYAQVGAMERVVVPGQKHDMDGASYIEILSGLSAGDIVVLP